MVEQLGEALESWVSAPYEVAIKQTHFRLAVELSAIKQCMEMGILDEFGEPVERVRKLIDEYHGRTPIGQQTLF